MVLATRTEARPGLGAGGGRRREPWRFPGAGPSQADWGRRSAWPGAARSRRAAADGLLNSRLFFSKQEKKCFRWLLSCRPQFLLLKARAGRSWGARDGASPFAGPVGEEGSPTSGPKGVLGGGVRSVACGPRPTPTLAVWGGPLVLAAFSTVAQVPAV